jgi:DNA-binding response OmpR family regulator
LHGGGGRITPRVYSALQLATCAPSGMNFRRILLIDDDPLVAQLIGMVVGAFRGDTFAMDHVTSYAEGLQRLMSGHYVVCLLDYRLADRNGLELLREAKSRNCPTPIILLTADDREETDIAAMQGGAADFINKRDLKPEGLERSVDYAIKTAAALNELMAKSKPKP